MAQKFRVSNIDNEDDRHHLEVSELNAEGLALKIGHLLQRLMEIDQKDGHSESSSDVQDSISLINSYDVNSKNNDEMNSAMINSGTSVGGNASVILRAAEVHSIVEEKKRRDAERTAAAIVLREREMFLKAALQLLDQRESGMGDNGAPLITTTGKNNNDNNSTKKDSTEDAIRIGMLKKYSKGSFLRGTGSISYNWHEKVVELKHGAFVYREKGSDNTWIPNMFGTNDKVIKLGIDAVYCRPVKLDGDEVEEDEKLGDLQLDAKKKKKKEKRRLVNCIFEISEYDGTQRLWLAGSRSERDAWVRSINTAMIGSAGDFIASDDSAPGSVKYVFQAPTLPESLQKSLDGDKGGKKRSDTTGSAVDVAMPSMRDSELDMNLGLNLVLDDDGLSGKEEISGGRREGTPNYDNDSVSISSEGSNSGVITLATAKGNTRTTSTAHLSVEGAAAPYAEDIAQFISLKMALQTVRSKDAYKNLMTRLSTKTIAVPVFYVKSSLGGNFQMAQEDKLTRQTLTSLNQSQVWKDLQRDAVLINSETINGAEKGAEGMVGALVRNIVDKADSIRTILRVSALNEARANPGAKVSSMDYPSFDLSEGQILACARDLLVLTGRTQSGGDTYFCVDSLLVNKETGLCFLAPVASKISPLEYTVDIVESGQQGSQKRGSWFGNKDISNNTTKTGISSNIPLRESRQSTTAALANKQGHDTLKNDAKEKETKISTHNSTSQDSNDGDQKIRMAMASKLNDLEVNMEEEDTSLAIKLRTDSAASGASGSSGSPCTDIEGTAANRKNDLALSIQLLDDDGSTSDGSPRTSPYLNMMEPLAVGQMASNINKTRNWDEGSQMSDLTDLTDFNTSSRPPFRVGSGQRTNPGLTAKELQRNQTMKKDAYTHAVNLGAIEEHHPAMRKGMLGGSEFAAPTSGGNRIRSGSASGPRMSGSAATALLTTSNTLSSSNTAFEDKRRKYSPKPDTAIAPIDVVNYSKNSDGYATGNTRDKLIPTSLNQSLFKANTDAPSNNGSRGRDSGGDKKRNRRSQSVDSGRESQHRGSGFFSRWTSPKGNKKTDTDKDEDVSSGNTTASDSSGSGLMHHHPASPLTKFMSKAGLTNKDISNNSISTDNHTGNTTSKGGVLSRVDFRNLPEFYVPTMCIRVTVKGVSHFKICDLDPQDEANSTFAYVKGRHTLCISSL
jgi:hypothetical protein